MNKRWWLIKLARLLENKKRNPAYSNGREIIALVKEIEDIAYNKGENDLKDACDEARKGDTE